MTNSFVPCGGDGWAAWGIHRREANVPPMVNEKKKNLQKQDGYLLEKKNRFVIKPLNFTRFIFKKL